MPLDSVQSVNSIYIDGFTGYLGSFAKSYFVNGQHPVYFGKRSDYQKISSSDISVVFLFSGLQSSLLPDLLDVHLYHPLSLIHHFSSHPTHFIYSSSGSVYGSELGSPASLETDPVRDHDHYSYAKILAENSIQELCEQNGHTLTILRLPPLVGPRPNTGVVHKMLSQYRLYNHIKIYGDGSSYRDFLSLSDLCSLLNYIVQYRVPGIFNISSPAHCSILQLATSIIGSTSPILFLPQSHNSLQQLHLNDDLIRSISSINANCASIKDIITYARG